MANIDETLGTDISHKKDFEKAPHGDIALIVGKPNLHSALLRRIVTEKGAVIHRPNYGCGLGKFQNAPMTCSAG